MVARFVRDEEAVGSNPATPTARLQVRGMLVRRGTDLAAGKYSNGPPGSVARGVCTDLVDRNGPRKTQFTGGGAERLLRLGLLTRDRLANPTSDVDWTSRRPARTAASIRRSALTMPSRR